MGQIDPNTAQQTKYLFIYWKYIYQQHQTNINKDPWWTIPYLWYKRPTEITLKTKPACKYQFSYLELSQVFSKFKHSAILFVILTIPLVDKNLTFHLYRIHNLSLLHPMLQNFFQYEMEHRNYVIRSDLY